MKKACDVLLYDDIIAAHLMGTEDAVMKMLIGKNILTSSLVTTGWKFWDKLLVTEKEKAAIESAVMRYIEVKTIQAKAIKDAFDELPKKNTHSSLVMLASLRDVVLSCMQQLSKDLKEVLRSSKTE